MRPLPPPAAAKTSTTADGVTRNSWLRAHVPVKSKRHPESR